MPNPLAADLEHVLAHTSGVWNEFAGARLFLTGGTGFFGCWLLESFAWACDHAGLDAEILVLTRSPEKFRAKAPHLAVHRGIGILEGDVRAFQFPQGRFTHVIHGATDASAQLIREQPLLMLDTIVEGTRRTLDFAVTAGARRFLLLSSGAVYAQPDPADPGTVYAEGKRVAELLCSLYSRQYPVECLTARCFAFVGPYLPLDAHYAIGNFVGDCLAGKPIEIRGDGTPCRSYLYAGDLAAWLWTILARGASSSAYNVGSENAVSIGELAIKVRDALGAENPIRLARLPGSGTPPERYVPVTSHTRRELGLEEWTPLEDAIRRTAEWHSGLAGLPGTAVGASTICE